MNLLKEIFVACLDPYIDFISNWVNKGELKDPMSEFFIKTNDKAFEKEKEASSKT